MPLTCHYCTPVASAVAWVTNHFARSVVAMTTSSAETTTTSSSGGSATHDITNSCDSLSTGSNSANISTARSCDDSDSDDAPSDDDADAHIGDTSTSTSSSNTVIRGNAPYSKPRSLFNTCAASAACLSLLLTNVSITLSYFQVSSILNTSS
jgi:hypothetical protein